MKKFELLNNKWIKQIEFRDDITTIKSHFCFIKIDTISFWDHRVVEIFGKFTHLIILYSDCGQEMRLEYEKNEANQYQEDLLFFQNLLF